MTALQEAKRREQTAKRRAERERYAMNPSELMSAARFAAVEATKRLPRVSEDERDALAQIVALKVLEGGAERGSAGRAYLQRIADSVVAGRSAGADDWRDCAAEYRESRERKRGESPSTFALEGASEGGWLGVALAREAERAGDMRPASLPEDLREIARAMADAESALPAERAALYAALLARLPDPESGNAPSGVAIAALLGVTHAAARKRVSRGSALWRERYNPHTLAALIRATGAALGAERGEGEPHSWRAARAAVESVASERKRDGAPRGAYSPATVRAARRNLRAERRTGRYGRTLPTTRRERPTRRMALPAERVERFPRSPVPALYRLAAERAWQRVAEQRERIGY